MGTVINNRGTSCVGVCKTGNTLIRVSTVMGTLYGEARGEARGIMTNRTEMIQNMLKENISVDVIAKVAKITVEQVIAIGKKAAIL